MIFAYKINMMRLAISYWQNCIAPVFDVSENLLLIDIVNNQVTKSVSAGLDSVLPFMRAKKLSDLEVDVLICGAISQTLTMAVSGQDIKIISYVFGPWEDILQRYINGQLSDGCDDRFPVLGKGRQRKRHRHRGN